MTFGYSALSYELFADSVFERDGAGVGREFGPHAASQQGSTLLELMVTVLILGILMAIGLPQMSDWIRRSSVSAAAESLQNGLRRATTEAIRRNMRVEFLLTNSTPTIEGVASLVPVANGVNWVARTQAGVETGISHVASLAMREISAEVEVSGPASLLFNGMGRVSNATGTAISSSQFYRLTRTGTDRAVCVFVTPGGAVKACDPSLAIGHPFACRPQVSLIQCPAP